MSTETDFRLRAQIEEWYADYAEIIDEKMANDWVSSFVDNGIYAVGTHNNVSTTGAWWYTDRGLVFLKERAAYNGGYFWHAPTRTLLSINNIRVRELADGQIAVKAAFVMHASDHQQNARVHVVGRYTDILTRTADGFRFVEHRVVIEGETVPANMGVFL